MVINLNVNINGITLEETMAVFMVSWGYEWDHWVFIHRMIIGFAWNDYGMWKPPIILLIIFQPGAPMGFPHLCWFRANPG